MTSPIDRMFAGEGARAVVVVWGVSRNIAHAYLQHVYAPDISTVMWKALCGRSVRPKLGVAEPVKVVPMNACFTCRQAAEARAKGTT